MESICFLFAAAIFFLQANHAFLAAASALSLSAGSLINNGSNTDDASSLFEFRAHITADPFNILANWSSKTSFCNWAGVSCHHSFQRVIALNISGLNLEGTISPSIANLTFLTSLDFSNNYFHGSIPIQLSNLQSLKQIHFGRNNFSGMIPPSIGNISELERLNLEYNYLVGNIPNGIANLSSLKTLSLGNNQLTGPLPSGFLNKMAFLEEIDLAGNSLTGLLRPGDLFNPQYSSRLKGFNLSFNSFEGEIPGELYKFWKELQQLSLSFNNFHGTIPRTLGYLTRLKVLDIGGNTLSGRIPGEISNLTHLEMLNIQSGSLSGGIPASVFNLSSLRVIDLSNNSLSWSCFPVVANLPVLEVLYLPYNQLNGSIPSFIWECKSLVYLDLKQNFFTGGISKSLTNLTSLKFLSLDSNMLTGELPVGFNKILNLQYLGVSANNLSGRLDPKLFNMSSLLFLTLGENYFSGALPSTIWITLPNLLRINLQENRFTGMIPSAISNASKLFEISVSINQLTGPIPTTLGNFKFLKRLFLGGNNFTSSGGELTFISSLTNCRQLEMVEMSENQFNGFLPTSIGNLSESLLVFNAFGTKITGSIPSQIGNLSNLHAINLDNNEFVGVIPASLGKLKLAEAIYLEHNKLEGHIPPELCQLPILSDLYLNDNLLNGSIPDCLGQIKSLRRIFLESNNFTSEIPTSLWNLNDLLGLNLSSNSLSGILSPGVQNLRAITQLDLSWNQLTGDIPSSIGTSKTLVYFSLAGNGFEGGIPQTLGNMVSLEHLDLSHNNISGRIPKALENLTYLKYLDLSFNNLEGEIPAGGPFINFTAESFAHNYALCSTAPGLHVQSCQTAKVSKSRPDQKLLRYILPCILFGIGLFAAAYFWGRSRRRRRKDHMAAPAKTSDISVPHPWRRLSYHEIFKATDSFSPQNLLGSGSFGSVFRGKLSDGSNVAIKVFHLQSEGALRSFGTECEALASIRHRNIIKILSCCSNEDFKALVLEYMPNGSLESWLYSSGSFFLDMLQRLNVAIDVAAALEYLHHDHGPPIVHCDLKPSNILMMDEDDHRMGACISDFGVAKLFEESEIMIQTKTMATIGYMAPEYGTEGLVTTAGDVYSYGVVLLELFTRKKPTDDMFGERLNLRDWVSKAILGNSVMEVVDYHLKMRQVEDQNLDEMKECITNIFHVGIQCLSDSPQERISSRDIGTRLKNIKASLI